MLDLSKIIDLPLILAILIGGVFLLYIIFQGWYIGLGILFPFAPTVECRNIIFGLPPSFWIWNEILLLFGSILLFYAFPLTSSLLLPTLYIPLSLMLCGTVLRIVALKYRKSVGNALIKFNYMIHLGSVLAGFSQGLIFGNFLYGVKEESSTFNHISISHVMVGIAVLFWYILLGSTGLMAKSESQIQNWIKNAAYFSLFFVGIIIVMVLFSISIINPESIENWLSIPNIFYLSPIPILIVSFFIMLFYEIKKGQNNNRPFLLAIGICILSYLCQGINLYPYIIPYQYTIYEAAASDDTLLLMLCVGYILGATLGFRNYRMLRNFFSIKISF